MVKMQIFHQKFLEILENLEDLDNLEVLEDLEVLEPLEKLASRPAQIVNAR